MNNLSNDGRQFVSFSGVCPFKCNHCYTFCEGYSLDSDDLSAESIIDHIKENDFNMIYVSGHRENFVDRELGIHLCERLYSKFHTDILVTTRCTFNSAEVNRFAKLNSQMRENGNALFFCMSIPALESYKKLEPSPLVPTPDERISCLGKMYDAGILTILTIRPLCPTQYIPVEEPLEILQKCSRISSGVISSGIVVDQTILNRLPGFPTNFTYTEAPLMSCLGNDNIQMKYVNVNLELLQLQKSCSNLGLPFFMNSMPLIEYLKSITL